MPELFRIMYIIYQKKIICPKKIRTGKTVGDTSSRQRKLYAIIIIDKKNSF
jgi:hypothetical protein